MLAPKIGVTNYLVMFLSGIDQCGGSVWVRVVARLKSKGRWFVVS